MLTRWEPHDYIALTLIGCAVFLNIRGDTIIAPMLLSSIIGFYFGRKASDNTTNEPQN